MVGVFPAWIKSGFLRKSGFMLVLTTRRIILLPLKTVGESCRESRDEGLIREVNGVTVVRGNGDVEKLLAGGTPILLQVSSEDLTRFISDLRGFYVGLGEVLKAVLDVERLTLTVTHLRGVYEIYLDSEAEGLQELGDQMKGLLGARFEMRGVGED